jgi:membrane protease YdiL (CAAX protease family)
VCAALGWALRALLGTGAAWGFSEQAVLLGAAVFAVVLASDVLIHGALCLLFGEPYRRRYRALAELFRGQSLAAMLVGAVLAGLGEELLFRGLGTGPLYLGGAAVLFGVLHHIRRSLWPFTVWAAYQGMLLAGALYLTQALCVTVVAHGLHDLAGFLVFRLRNRGW